MEILKVKRILIVVSCLLFFASNAYSSEAVGNVVVVIGSVSVKRVSTGEKETLAAQHELFLNDVIITGPDGLAKLLLRDETILKISPNSEVVISEMIAGPDAEGRSTVDLLKGRLRSVIGNKLGANTTFDVNTPVAVAGVRGTDFEVVHLLVDGEWVSGVRCYDGSVAVAASGLGFETLGDVILLPSQYTLATATTAPTAAAVISPDKSLAEELGVADEGSDTSDVDFDLQLDEVEIQTILLDITNLDTSVLEGIAQSIGLQVPGTRNTNTGGSNSNEPTGIENNPFVNISVDPQLEIITETIIEPLPGVNLEFDIQLPAPLEVDVL